MVRFIDRTGRRQYDVTAKPATLEEVAETLDKLSDERHAKCEWNYYIPTFRQIDNNLVFWLMEDEPHF